MIETAKREKKTRRTGKKCGAKRRAIVSISMNDDDRNLSRLWEQIKRYHSNNRQTSAETARRVFLRGMCAEFEEIIINSRDKDVEECEKNQENLKLF